MSIITKTASIALVSLLVSLPAHAEVEVSVLDFELDDITYAQQDSAAEAERTAALRGLVEKGLEAKGGYEIVPIDRADQAAATKGTGYLWEHPDEAAALGAAAGSRFVVVGQVTKPTYLFEYVAARVIDVQRREVIGEFYVELKGQLKHLSQRGVDRLVRKIDARLEASAKPKASEARAVAGSPSLALLR